MFTADPAGIIGDPAGAPGVPAPGAPAGAAGFWPNRSGFAAISRRLAFL